MHEVEGLAMLFCPADRPDRYAKAQERADFVIYDLEDAVGEAAKDNARDQLAAHLSEVTQNAAVRVNGKATPFYDADIEMVRGSGCDIVMLPKVGSRQDVEDLSPLRVIALVETSEGVLNCIEVAQASNCLALMWGGEDLVADIGGRSSRDARGTYYPLVDHARSQVLLAAAAAERPAIDGVFVDIKDLQGLADEARAGVDVGFSAKACIHPRHVPVIREAYAPDPTALAWAQGLLAEMEKEGGGVFMYEGRMVDGPMYEHARAVVKAAGLQVEARN